MIRTVSGVPIASFIAGNTKIVQNAASFTNM